MQDHALHLARDRYHAAPAASVDPSRRAARVGPWGAGPGPRYAARVPRVLMVYANPAVTAQPVPPYGLECVAHAFRVAGVEVEVLSPYLEQDPLAALRAALATAPSLVGFSVRNLDDALVVREATGDGDIDTLDYTGAVVPLVEAAVQAVGRDNVVIGGGAVGAAPRAVGRALGARWVVAGPAEDLCWRAGRALATEGRVRWPDDARVVDTDAPAPGGNSDDASPGERGPSPGAGGHVARTPPPLATRRAAAAAWRPVPGPTPRDGTWLRLAVARGARVAVAVATGCDRRCAFCVEPAFTGGRVRPRAVGDVVAEVRLLAEAGVRRFWLACSEVNAAGTAPAVALFGALRQAGLAVPGGPLDFTTYIQPAPVDETLLDALERAGLDPSALSFEFGHLDDTVLRAGGGPTNRRQVDQLVDLWQRRGYRVLGGSVLFGAHPAETEATLARALRAAREIDTALPGGFGLAYACGARVYPGSPLARWVERSPGEAAPHLYARPGDTVDPSWVRPVVYCTPWAPRALLSHVGRALEGTRAPMRPMNAEAAHAPAAVHAEALVNRAIAWAHRGRPIEALGLLDAALDAVPAHHEALSQGAQLAANVLGDRARALHYLSRLLHVLDPRDARRGEVERALRALGQPPTGR